MTTTSLTDQFLNLIKLKPNYSLKISEFKEKLIDCRTSKDLDLLVEETIEQWTLISSNKQKFEALKTNYDDLYYTIYTLHYIDLISPSHKIPNLTLIFHLTALMISNSQYFNTAQNQNNNQGFISPILNNLTNTQTLIKRDLKLISYKFLNFRLNKGISNNNENQLFLENFNSIYKDLKSNNFNLKLISLKSLLNTPNLDQLNYYLIEILDNWSTINPLLKKYTLLLLYRTMDIRQETGNKLRDPPISISKLVTLVMEGIKQGWSQEASLLLISLLIKNFNFPSKSIIFEVTNTLNLCLSQTPSNINNSSQYSNYHGLINPWVQLKCLRIMAKVSLQHPYLNKMFIPLVLNCLDNCKKHSKASFAITYECIKTLTIMSSKEDLPPPTTATPPSTPEQSSDNLLTEIQLTSSETLLEDETYVQVKDKILEIIFYHLNKRNELSILLGLNSLLILLEAYLSPKISNDHLLLVDYNTPKFQEIISVLLKILEVEESNELKLKSFNLLLLIFLKFDNFKLPLSILKTLNNQALSLACINLIFNKLEYPNTENDFGDLLKGILIIIISDLTKQYPKLSKIELDQVEEFEILTLFEVCSLESIKPWENILLIIIKQIKLSTENLIQLINKLISLANLKFEESDTDNFKFNLVQFIIDNLSNPTLLFTPGDLELIDFYTVFSNWNLNIQVKNQLVHNLEELN